MLPQRAISSMTSVMRAQHGVPCCLCSAISMTYFEGPKDKSILLMYNGSILVHVVLYIQKDKQQWNFKAIVVDENYKDEYVQLCETFFAALVAANVI